MITAGLRRGIEKLENGCTEEEKRFAQLEATIQDLLVALERNIEELRERAALKPHKPKLVADRGSDAAD